MKDDVKQLILKFRNDRNWGKFHNADLTIEKQIETEFAAVFATRKGTESYES